MISNLAPGGTASGCSPSILEGDPPPYEMEFERSIPDTLELPWFAANGSQSARPISRGGMFALKELLKGSITSIGVRGDIPTPFLGSTLEIPSLPPSRLASLGREGSMKYLKIPMATELLSCFFLDFLSRNGLSSTPYSQQTLSTIQRSFVINPLHQDISEEVVLEHFPHATKHQLSNALTWFEMDPSINMGSSPLFRQGKILSMDFPSIFAIWILNLQSNDHVLDMCCAPGLKLSLAASIVGTSGVGSVTGIDISPHRLRNAASLVKKFKVPKCRLFRGNSATPFAESIGVAIPENQFSRQEGQKSFMLSDVAQQNNKPFYSTSQYRKRRCYHQAFPTYDKIILDAQCTHDGSIKHVLKSLFKCNTILSHSDNILDKFHWSLEHELNTIEVQKKLLRSAFSFLKEDGTLVYCTCR